MKSFNGKVAVITGAGSGFGLEVARIAAREGMKLVLLDVQADALERAAAEFADQEVIARRIDVSKADQMEALAKEVAERFCAPHFVFNNAGVGAGGLIWENSVADWEWVLGVNLMGVIHGVRLFTPMMLAAAKADAAYEGHIVNTASMAGLLAPPNMGVYNVSKHGVVALTETLHQDLALVTEQVRCSVLCPYFVPTGIAHSERNRPEGQAAAQNTRSQRVGAKMIEQAVNHGKLTAADVAAMVFESMREERFYILTHPQAMGGVKERMTDILENRNPSDPFAAVPALGEQLRGALRG